MWLHTKLWSINAIFKTNTFGGNMVYELWFKGVNPSELTAKHFKKQHNDRLDADGFLLYVEDFILQRLVSTKYLDMYAVMEYTDTETQIPSKCESLSVWAEEAGLDLNSKTKDNTCYHIDGETYACISNRFKMSDEFIVKTHVREAMNRAISYYNR